LKDEGLGHMDAAAKRALLERLLRERVALGDSMHPLSIGQEALWIVHQLALESPAYNVAFCARVHTVLDRKRLEHALGGILKRHPMLRATYVATEEGVRQRIGPLPGTILERIDASRWDAEGLRSQVRDSYVRPFDLVKGPVFRATLFEGSEGGDVLLLVLHHIVFDAYSLGLLLSDLSSLYDGGSSPDRIGPRGNYFDFVDWQRELVATPHGAAMWDYWRTRLSGPLPGLDLPGGRVRSASQTPRGATHHFALPADLCKGIRDLARGEGATPFMVLAAAFQGLFFRYTGKEDVLVGTTLAGRPRSEFEDVLGYFVNPVVLRSPIGPGASFRKHIGAVREAVIGAIKNGDFPFFELVKRLSPERDLTSTPIFQMLFNLIKSTQVSLDGDFASGIVRMGSLEIEQFPLEQQEATQFDLVLNMLDTGGGMPATLKYRTDLFESGTIERMTGHFRTLLESAVADPDRPVSELSLLSPEEERTILVEWNRTEGDYATDTSLNELVEAQVDRTPDAVAVASESGDITYRDMDDRANRIANRLRRLGVGRESLVGVCLYRSIDLVSAFLGILKAGGGYVPIDPTLPRGRMAYIFGDAEVSVVLTERSLAAEIPAGRVPVVVLERDTDLANESTSRPSRVTTPESLAYVIYTSGSTGKPKGTEIHHRAIVNYLRWKNRALPLGTGDAVLQHLSPGFDASGLEIWPPLTCGARLVLAGASSQADPNHLVQAVIENDVTEMVFVPSLLELVSREPDLEKCRTLRRILVGGEPLSRRLVDMVWGRLDVEIINLYGPTEATINATSWPVERGPGPFPPMVPIGRPITNLRAYVLDTRLCPVPIGVPGELYIGGMGVGRGYLRRPDLTSEKFIPDPFVSGGKLYKTGDICRLRADGALDYLGRNDQQVKIRGFRIELGEIEAALAEHPTVGQAVVVAHEESTGDVRLVAYVVSRPQATVEAAGLRTYLRDRVPEYMVPSAFVILDSLPLAPSGKVDRNALPAAESTALSSMAPYEAPRNPMEAAIASIWKEVLRLEKVGIHDNFFDLGGHSLLLIQVQTRLEQQMQRKVEYVDLFQYPKIEALSRHLECDEDVSQTRERIYSRADRQRQALRRQRDRKDRSENTP